MRRVRNPYGSSDLSGSQKSQTSLSQSMAKSKRRIEIEKVSDNEGNDGVGEDSYQDDDFEENELPEEDDGVEAQIGKAAHVTNEVFSPKVVDTGKNEKELGTKLTKIY